MSGKTDFFFVSVAFNKFGLNSFLKDKLNKVMNKKLISLLLNILKYVITALLGYFGGSAL